MKTFSRRQFLKQIGALTALGFLNQSGFPFPVFSFSDDTAPFEMLVVGDSVIFGQGLKEEHKFYYLTKNWLETEVFARQRQVNLNVKAHSGATITLHDDEAEILRKAGIDTNKFYPPELNIAFPTVWTQIDLARKEYENPSSVNLIMMTAGITDIKTSNILNVFGSEEKIRADIPKYCNEAMFGLLQHSAETFPNALIVVVGYFPMISPKSSTHKVFNAILELYGLPRPTKPLLNNVLTKPFLKIVRKKMINRSRYWVENSNIELQKAVNRTNAKLGKEQVIFVKSPITEENCFGTKNSLVWGMGKKGRSGDEAYQERVAACNKELVELRDWTNRDYSVRFCELAGIGHPNIEGSKAYSEAIKSSLKTKFLNVSLGKTL